MLFFILTSIHFKILIKRFCDELTDAGLMKLSETLMNLKHLSNLHLDFWLNIFNYYLMYFKILYSLYIILN